MVTSVMESVLVPRKLQFTGDDPDTPSARPGSRQNASQPHQHAASYNPTTVPGPQATAADFSSPIVRYGVPPDPDAAYYARFTAGAQVVRYGLCAPSSDEDSDEEGEDSWGIRPAAPISAPSPVEDLMYQLQREWQSQAELLSAERTAKLMDALGAADQQLAQDLAAIDQRMKEKQAMIAKADAQQAAALLRAREATLQEVQRTHDEAAARSQAHVAQLERAAQEAARKEEALRQQRAAAEAAAAAEKAAAEKAAAEERARKDAAARKAAEEAAAAAAAAAATAGGPAPAAAASQAPLAAAAAAPAVPGQQAGSLKAIAARCQRSAPEALAFEKQTAARSDEIHAGLKPLMDNEATKKDRRTIEKRMTIHVQQISGTLDQVARKCQQVYQEIAEKPDLAWRAYAMLMFATKFVKQRDLVQLNNKAAFPLAAVLVKVSHFFPDLMHLTLNQLHRECCFSVPCTFVARDERSGAELNPLQLHRLLGYQEQEADDQPGVKVLESNDSFVQRVEGIMFTYGAIVQVQDGPNPHGLDWGWRWLARFLNAIPASRAAGKALIFFLRAAGWALHLRYRSQFIKLLKCMYDEFLPELARSDEADVQSVHALLKSYVEQGQYKIEPEGHKMPKIDVSSYQRA